jgi:hypothetical protein
MQVMKPSWGQPLPQDYNQWIIERRQQLQLQPQHYYSSVQNPPRQGWREAEA